MDGTSTLGALTVGFILVTICLTARLLYEVRDHRARFLVGMVGIIAVCHGLRLVTDPEIGGIPAPAAYGVLVDLLVAILVFAALLILSVETARHRATQVHLRLSQAMEPPAKGAGDEAVSHALATYQSSESGSSSERPEVKLYRMIQASSVAIVGLDRNGNVCTSNPAAEKLFGVAEGGLLGHPLPSRKASRPDDEPNSGLQTAEAHS